MLWRGLRVFKPKRERAHCVFREFLDEWVRAVNEHGGFGTWAWDVSRHSKDIESILEKHNAPARWVTNPTIMALHS